MFTLIKRELESLTIYFLLPIMILCPCIVYLFSVTAYHYQKTAPIGIHIGIVIIHWVPLCVLPIVAAGIGSYQTQSDRLRKLSAYLVTLSTSRNQIFLARLTGGIFYIVLMLLLLGVALIVLCRIYPVIHPVWVPLLTRLFLVSFLACLAGYGIGMLLGFQANRFGPIFGPILLTILLYGLIVVKGLGWQSSLLLSLVAGLSLIRSWQKYKTDSL